MASLLVTSPRYAYTGLARMRFGSAYTPDMTTNAPKKPILNEIEREFVNGGKPPGRKNFVELLLAHAGPGQPGLSQEARTHTTIEGKAFPFPHTVIAYRDNAGHPVAVATVAPDPTVTTRTRYVIHQLGVNHQAGGSNKDKVDTNLPKKALLSVMGAIDQLDPNWIVAETTSKSMRQFALIYTKMNGRPRSAREIFYEGDFDKAGVWRPSGPCPSAPRIVYP